MIFVTSQIDAQFSIYVYFYSLHDSGSNVAIIRRIVVSMQHLVYATLSLFQTFAVFWMLYASFWVIPGHLNFICQRFGTLCPFHLHGQVGMKTEQSVPKRRHVEFWRQGITQKKAYNGYFWSKVHRQFSPINIAG